MASPKSPVPPLSDPARQYIFLIDRSPFIVEMVQGVPTIVNRSTGGAAGVAWADAVAALEAGHEAVFVSVAKTRAEKQIAASGQPITMDFGGQKIECHYVQIPDRTYRLARDGMFSGQLWLLLQEQDHPEIRENFVHAMWEGYELTNEIIANAVNDIAKENAVVFANDTHVALVADYLIKPVQREGEKLREARYDIDTVFVGHTAWPSLAFVRQHVLNRSDVRKNYLPERYWERLVRSISEFDSINYSGAGWAHNFARTATDGFEINGLPPIGDVAVPLDAENVREQFATSLAEIERADFPVTLVQSELRRVRRLVGDAQVVGTGGRAEWYKNIDKVVAAEVKRRQYDPDAKPSITAVLSSVTRPTVPGYTEHYEDDVVAAIDAANKLLAPKEFARIENELRYNTISIKELTERATQEELFVLDKARLERLIDANARLREESPLPIRLINGNDYNKVLAWMAVTDVWVTAAHVEGYNLMALEQQVVGKPESVQVLTRTTGLSHHIDRAQDEKGWRTDDGTFAARRPATFEVQMSVVRVDPGEGAPAQQRLLDLDVMNLAITTAQALRLPPSVKREMHAELQRIPDVTTPENHLSLLVQGLSRSIDARCTAAVESARSVGAISQRNAHRLVRYGRDSALPEALLREALDNSYAVASNGIKVVGPDPEQPAVGQQPAERVPDYAPAPAHDPLPGTGPSELRRSAQRSSHSLGLGGFGGM